MFDSIFNRGLSFSDGFQLQRYICNGVVDVEFHNGKCGSLGHVLVLICLFHNQGRYIKALDVT